MLLMTFLAIDKPYDMNMNRMYLITQITLLSIGKCGTDTKSITSYALPVNHSIVPSLNMYYKLNILIIF